MGQITNLDPLVPWLRRRGVGGLELALMAMAEIGAVVLALLVALAVRLQSPELMEWGRHFLNPFRGALLGVSLVGGGLLLGAAGLFAGRRNRRMQIAALVAALLCGAGFLLVLAIDFEHKAYRNLLPGSGFSPDERYVAYRFGERLPLDDAAAGGSVAASSDTTGVAATSVATGEAPPAGHEADADAGRTVFLRVCASCHGARGEGMTGSGLPLVTSGFVAERDDEELVAFLQVGRQPWDADNTTGVQMPPRGGDPRVRTEDLQDVTAYLRKLQERGVPALERSSNAPSESPTGAGAEPESTAIADANADANADAETGAESVVAGSAEPALTMEDLLLGHRSFIPEPAPEPSGLSADYLARAQRKEWAIPSNARDYFGLFFSLSGVVLLHVLLANVIVGVELVRTLRAKRTCGPRWSLILTAASWWWATIVWFLAWTSLSL